jgi:hypothetical protein
MVHDGPSPGKAYGRSLLPQHRADLHRSGLSDEQIDLCGFYSESDPYKINDILKWSSVKSIIMANIAPCLAIPYFGTDGKPIDYVRLKSDTPRTSNGKPVKYESPRGVSNRSYFPPLTRTILADPSVPLLLTEGEKKAAKADQEGFACIGLVGVYGWMLKRLKGSDGKKSGPRELITDLAAIAWSGRRVIIAYDSDIVDKSEVRLAEHYLAETLRAVGADMRAIRLPSNPDGSKVGLDEYLVTHGREALRRLIATAGCVSSPAVIVQTTKGVPMCAESIALTVTSAVGKPGRYLTVSTNGVGELHRDVIDLNSATGRKRFVSGTMKAAFRDKPADDWPEDVQADLENKLVKLAADPPRDPSPPPTAEAAPVDLRIAELAKMPRDIREEAEEVLRNPDLLQRVAEAIRTQGVAGEEDTALCVYLIGTSTQLPRPLAGIVRGPSTSGKSYVVQQVGGMFPPEVVLIATSLTTNALYYFPSGTLRHRFVIAGERSRVEDDDQAEATRALREMIESGRLSKAVPVKIGDRYQTDLIEQEGPIAFIETTTAAHIFDEDANRCLMLSTDEREDQTKRILAATGASAAGKREGDPERVRAVHHALQRMLPRLDVVIPFAESVSELYPTSRLEARRELRHLLQLVKAIALLRFRQRQRRKSGEIVATLADYEDATRLAAGPLGTATSGVSKGAERFLTHLESEFALREFTTTEAKAIGVGSRSPVYGWLIELSNAGSIEQTQQGRGRVPAKWRRVDHDQDATPTGLPSAVDVWNRYLERTQGHKT